VTELGPKKAVRQQQLPKLVSAAEAGRQQQQGGAVHDTRGHEDKVAKLRSQLEALWATSRSSSSSSVGVGKPAPAASTLTQALRASDGCGACCQAQPQWEEGDEQCGSCCTVTVRACSVAA